MEWNIIHVPETESTNLYAKNIHSIPAFIYADYQTKGKGQQNSAWYSEPKKNLLCSVLINPNIHINKNNYLSRWISVILVELLKELHIPVQNICIKWPNDIIVQHPSDGYKKICGILIENAIDKDIVAKSIIGVGLNINQTDFRHLNKIATSVLTITNQKHNIKNIIELLIELINDYYPLIQYQKYDIINKQYIQYLYGWNTNFLFQHHQQIYNGKIIQLNDDGSISIQTTEFTRRFQNKEIQFLI